MARRVKIDPSTVHTQRAEYSSDRGRQIQLVTSLLPMVADGR